MSDPYNQYPPQGHYGHSPAPSGGYGAPSYQQQGGYNQGYPQQQQGYGSGYGSPAPSEFGPPQRRDSYGPPASGGFQHGYEGGQFGSYEASNPQGHAGYYGQQHNTQQQHYDSSQQQVQHYQGNQQNYDAQSQEQYRDPNGPPGSDFNPGGPEGAEGERGLGSALAGGTAGYFLGRKKNHGFLGAVGGAIVGNIVGNKLKEHGNQGHHGHHGHHGQQGGFGGSSWGGGRW
ncbi:MAG: hypothetical protein GOMPHAMPRED_005810 [Gomphillus americanus]|uniref:Glycine zipper 2TM domain-containing protein n=1 Tax=Gomphillus americanus TaxID=1940652 RepID=A0A8H3IK70_9LECA|nr:MAG: hypothetical protein GOMPHAMPRED_005810 [Gomphillus americanus]